MTTILERDRLSQHAEHQRGLPRVRALDGLRGVAVLAVVLYHAGVPHVAGGHLGVTVFFTLSGFLITSLLLLERERTGRISLRSFWGRRARRLVPALLLCFPLVAAVVALSSQPARSGLVGDAVASALWVANWRFVLAHQSYTDLFALPSPFQHFWSLAVEEQYYLLFPLVAAVVLARAGRRGLAVLMVQLVAVSTALGALLVAHAATISRAYYGTDSRIGEILVGALLAVLILRGEGLRELGPVARVAADVGGLVALAGLGVLISMLPYGDLRLFHGGLLLTALLTAAVILAAVQPGSQAARLLSLPPLVGLGLISYGVYLFHWPVFLLLTHSQTGANGLALLTLRLAVTLALAVTSYRLLEQPVRRGWLPTAPARVAWAAGAVTGVLVVALAAGVLPLPQWAPPATPAAVAAGPALGAAARPVPAPGASPLHTGSMAAHRGRTGPSAPAPAPAPAMSTQAQPLRTRQGSTSHALPKEFVGDGENYATAPPLPAVPSGALKVLVVGDSIGNNLGRGLLAWASGRTDVAVYNLAIPACPVSRGGDRRIGPDYDFPIRSWCPWWSDTSSPRYLAMQQFAPDVVLVEDGINAAFDRRLPSWSNWQEPGRPQFDRWTVTEYQSFIGDVRNLGAKVVVANAPCGDWQRLFNQISDGPQRVRSLDDLDYPQLTGVSSADFFSEICPNGQYSDTVDGVPNARPDGFHLTDQAATALARDWLGPLLLQTGHSSLGGLTQP
jgi:peptidoglycan/LPS O-acetylase OafA/YrhL